jgi:hypothetical protein
MEGIEERHPAIFHVPVCHKLHAAVSAAPARRRKADSVMEGIEERLAQWAQIPQINGEDMQVTWGTGNAGCWAWLHAQQATCCKGATQHALLRFELHGVMQS